MPKFGAESTRKLTSCNSDLIKICRELIKYEDVTVVSGYRNEEEQNALYPAYSRVKFPHSKHNSYPSNAIDLAPWKPGIGIDWEDEFAFVVMAGRVFQIADQFGIPIRWGGNWDRDYDISNDQQFYDLGHFELVLPEDSNDRIQ